MLSVKVVKKSKNLEYQGAKSFTLVTHWNLHAIEPMRGGKESCPGQIKPNIEKLEKKNQNFS